MNAHINTFGNNQSASAIHSWLAGLTQPFVRMIDILVERRQSRRTANALCRLDDNVLKDIGISRGEILGIAEQLASARAFGSRPVGTGVDRYRPYH